MHNGTYKIWIDVEIDSTLHQAVIRTSTITNSGICISTTDLWSIKTFKGDIELTSCIMYNDRYKL